MQVAGFLEWGQEKGSDIRGEVLFETGGEGIALLL